MSLFPIFIVFDSVSCYPSCSLSHTITHKKKRNTILLNSNIAHTVSVHKNGGVDSTAHFGLIHVQISPRKYTHICCINPAKLCVTAWPSLTTERIVYIFNYSINIVSNWISWFWALKPLKMLSLARSFGCIARFSD